MLKAFKCLKQNVLYLFRKDDKDEIKDISNKVNKERMKTERKF